MEMAEQMTHKKNIIVAWVEVIFKALAVCMLPRRRKIPIESGLALMVEHGFVNLDRDERVAVENIVVSLMSLEAVPRLRENFFYLLVAVEIGVDIYIRHLAHILGRIELGDIRALEKDMLYPRRRKQVFELAARHLLICTLEHEHIMAALEFRDDIRRDIPVFAQGVPQYICHIMLAGKLQQLFKIAAEIIRTAAFEHGAHKKNIIFVKLLHLYPPLSAVENSRSYLPDYFIILNDAEFSGKETAGIHQLVIIL